MAEITVGDKGRVVIPVSVRQAAGIDVGDELIVRAEASGRIVLETRPAVAQRIKSRFATGAGTVALRRARALDLQMETQRMHRQPQTAARDRDAERRKGDEILVALGVRNSVPEAS